MALPIIFMHLSNSPYLPFTLGQAKMTNLNQPVILIGDETNNRFPFVTHVRLNDFGAGAMAFRKVYKHLCTNAEAYELFCFQRWFVLRDFMMQHGIERCFHVDSDVLLYADALEEAARYERWDMTLIRGVGPGNMFLRLDCLREFCDLTQRMYSNPEQLADLEKQYRDRLARNEPGGICDMVAFSRYAQARPDRVGEMIHIEDGAAWDANIHEADGFEMNGKMKAIRYINKIPFCRQVATGQDVRYKCLHFQGGAKAHIEPCFRQCWPANAKAA